MTDIKETPLEDLVQSCVKAKEAIEELEANEKMLKDEIGDRLRKMKINGTKVGDYTVSRVKRLAFPDITLSQAKELGAVKETINQDILRKLIAGGAKIKHAITEFISIRYVENK